MSWIWLIVGALTGGIIGNRLVIWRLRWLYSEIERIDFYNQNLRLKHGYQGTLLMFWCWDLSRLVEPRTEEA